MSRFGDFLSHFANVPTNTSHQIVHPDEVDQRYEQFEMFSLGVDDGVKELQKRDRRTILTMWALMQKDPTIGSALNLHTTSALGGHEARGDVVFMTPKAELRTGGKNAKQLQALVEKEAKFIVPLLNKIAYSMARYGVGYGDSYARVYGAKGIGVTQILCNEYTEAPLIQAYERGGNTVGFHVLEKNDLQQRIITKLTPLQMVRMKMPRYAPVPQFRIGNFAFEQMLHQDDVSKLPIIPAEIGGSLLYEAETTWSNIQLLLQALNSQQIADSVEQAFLTVDVAGMPPEQRKKYRTGMVKMLQKHKDTVKSALMGGDAIWAKAWHVLPTWGDKQVLNAIGDLSQRSSPINTELLMLNLRRLSGLLGIDLSLLGWADTLSGGLGDGGFFHTSAQVAQKSTHIRGALSEAFNQIVNIHMGYKYGYMFEEHKIPWQFEFYSDISASTTEALNSKQLRFNTLSMFTGSLIALKELGLSRQSNYIMLSKIAGFDDEEVDVITQDLEKLVGQANTEAGQEDLHNPDNFDPDLDDEDY